MNILFLIDALEVGGAETHVVTLACALHRMGHAVTVISGGVLWRRNCERWECTASVFPRVFAGAHGR